MVQLTLGVQLGGQTFSEVLVFDDKESFEAFKRGPTGWAASASVVLVRAGGVVGVSPKPASAQVLRSEGGMGVEAAIGIQHVVVRPAVLTRKQAPAELGAGASA